VAWRREVLLVLNTYDCRRGLARVSPHFQYSNDGRPSKQKEGTQNPGLMNQHIKEWKPSLRNVYRQPYFSDERLNYHNSITSQAGRARTFGVLSIFIAALNSHLHMTQRQEYIAIYTECQDTYCKHRANPLHGSVSVPSMYLTACLCIAGGNCVPGDEVIDVVSNVSRPATNRQV
jgi:hypothetical protein